ncbi:MAG TPA: response regulator receiver protein [Cellvibrio sp.]|nr:response regulator receiver protein [Cellvibrio sp.]
MKIFKIDNDGFRYQELDLFIDDFIDAFPADMSDIAIHDFSRNNMSLAPYWPSMVTGFSVIEGKENLIPDIAAWIDATLLLSPRSYRLLGDLLSPYGEFLPIQIDNEIYQIFNCLTVVDVHSRSQDEVVFKPLEITDGIAMATYCTDRFREAVQSFGLKGIIFEPFN